MKILDVVYLTKPTRQLAMLNYNMQYPYLRILFPICSLKFLAIVFVTSVRC